MVWILTVKRGCVLSSNAVVSISCVDESSRRDMLAQLGITTSTMSMLLVLLLFQERRRIIRRCRQCDGDCEHCASSVFGVEWDARDRSSYRQTDRMIMTLTLYVYPSVLTRLLCNQKRQCELEQFHRRKATTAKDLQNWSREKRLSGCDASKPKTALTVTAKEVDGWVSWNTSAINQKTSKREN